DRTDGGLDVLEPAFGPIVLDLGIAGLVIGIVVFVALAIVLVFGWPLILLGLDLAWLLAVAGVGAIARLVLRRPWRVEAVAGGERRQWFVQGFRAAGRHRDEVARQFEHGLDPASGADTLTR
ncbi:hypothetical protein, partial [Ilumatobacter sp.]|uniref:hypothetical protein n=1 Tax=Ilumatobacter sp. TaxID=1967498 RepID=UPI003AF49DB7